jgi:5-methylcytosine-specific restriction endonuclease McrA
MSRHHEAVGWSGHTVRKARANIKAQLPLPCTECGSAVYDTDLWDVGHVIPLSLGGNPAHVGAAHRSCNRSNGGKMGNKIAGKGRPKEEKRTREW